VEAVALTKCEEYKKKNNATNYGACKIFAKQNEIIWEDYKKRMLNSSNLLLLIALVFASFNVLADQFGDTEERSARACNKKYHSQYFTGQPDEMIVLVASDYNDFPQICLQVDGREIKDSFCLFNCLPTWEQLDAYAIQKCEVYKRTNHYEYYQPCKVLTHNKLILDNSAKNDIKFQ
jgi:hypothetical protein